MRQPRVLRNVIANQETAASAHSSEPANPATGELLATAPLSARASAIAFDTWGQTTPSERQRALVR